MYTVEELIETLKKCPMDYEVFIRTPSIEGGIETIGIDPEDKVVDLFVDI